MPTQDYRLNGVKVPGVTTVNKNVGWSTENLMRWANRIGKEGIDLRDYRAQAAANIGTLVHGQIEAEILGLPAPEIPEEYRARVACGLETFKEWREQTRLEILGTELHGVDEEDKAGWCIDGLVGFEDRISVVDWKSGKGPFPEHFMQLATYVTFFERASGIKLHGAYIGKFSTESGIFHQVFWPRNILDVGYKAWTLARGLHMYRPIIEGYVR